MEDFCLKVGGKISRCLLKYEALSDEKIGQIKKVLGGRVYFHDYAVDDERYVSFSRTQPSKAERQESMSAYPTSPMALGMRKLGIRTMGYGRVK